MSSKVSTYKVKAGSLAFDLDRQTLADTSIYREADGSLSIIRDFKSRKVKVLEGKAGNGRQMQVEVDGEVFDITIETPLDQMLNSMGFHASAGKQVKEVKAPMPGLVLRIDVEDGQAVKEGDKLLILEAMKMENSIMIHADAIIKKILVKPGDAVEKNQVLIELE